MLTVTQHDYKKALCLGAIETAGKHLRGHPYSKDGEARARRYPLAWALPAIGYKYRGCAPALLALAKPDGAGLYIGGDSELQHAKALCRWLESSPDTAERLARVRQAFFSGLATGCRGQGVFYNDVERLRLLIAGADAVLPFLITNDASGLPNFAEYSRAIVLIHHAGVEEVAA